MRKKHFTSFFFIVTFFYNIQVFAAGVTINGTRVIYDGNKKEASISLTNSDDKPYLIQSWINENESKLSKGSFIITPPLFRLEQNEENTLRVIYIGGSLPTDRESLYWLNIKTIPSTKKDNNNNYLQIAVKSVIKLIYRPKEIDGYPEQYANKLIWSKQNNILMVKNPTPFYMNFQEITFGGKKISNVTFVAPMSEASFKVDTNQSQDVKWKIINDYGGISPQFNQIIK